MLQIIKNCFLFPNCSTNPQDKDDGKFEFILTNCGKGRQFQKNKTTQLGVNIKGFSMFDM